MNDETQMNIDELLATSLERLKNTLNGGIARKVELAPIVFLRDLLLEGRLRGLEFEPEQEPQPAYVPPDTSDSQGTASLPSMEITGLQGHVKYRISKRTRDAMVAVVTQRRLNTRQTAWMIDNYFIHELIHYDQGMSGGNHSQLSQHAPHVLLAIDYQADALAAVVATILAWCDPNEYVLQYHKFKGKSGSWELGEETSIPVVNELNHWTLYTYAIEAVLHQMEIFTLLSRNDMDRTKISEMKTGLERIQRIAVWHYQYHRVQEFNLSLPLADFQILAQPVLDFRNLAWASLVKDDELKRDWPDREVKLLAKWEKTEVDLRVGRMFNLSQRPQSVVVTGVSPFGSTRFVRHAPATEDDYKNAFAGFFELNTSGSRDLFTTLFTTHKWLVGRKDGGKGGDGGGGNGDDGSPNPPDLPGDTKALAVEKTDDERLDILKRMVTPSIFPLTWMVTQKIYA